MKVWWITVTICASALIVPAQAAAEPMEPPPFIPPNYGYPTVGLLAPGVVGRPFGYATFWNPIPPGGASGFFDAAGITVTTLADPDQRHLGMPGSRLGNAPNRMGPYGPAPGVNVSTEAAGGVNVAVTGTPGGESAAQTPVLGP